MPEGPAALPAFEHFSIFLFSNKMVVFGAGIHNMLLRIVNREDTDQTASLEAVRSGSALFSKPFFAGNQHSKF